MVQSILQQGCRRGGAAVKDELRAERVSVQAQHFSLEAET